MKTLLKKILSYIKYRFFAFFYLLLIIKIANLYYSKKWNLNIGLQKINLALILIMIIGKKLVTIVYFYLLWRKYNILQSINDWKFMKYQVQVIKNYYKKCSTKNKNK